MILDTRTCICYCWAHHPDLNWGRFTNTEARHVGVPRPGRPFPRPGASEFGWTVRFGPPRRDSFLARSRQSAIGRFESALRAVLNGADDRDLYPVTR